ncbi:MAG: peptide chain release factor N(5)-glutamine methyltransferase [Boseongicola sp.]
MTREEACRILRDAGVPDPANDTRRLFDYAFGDGEKSSSRNHNNPNSLTIKLFESAVKRRALRCPVSQITGFRAFWKSECFRVSPDVLDPRPETELLVEKCLEEPFDRVLDLGTGSGCIVISLLLDQPGASGVGTDISKRALQVATENGDLHGVAERLSWRVSDWFEDVDGKFDLIVSNPPYIAMAEIGNLQPEVRHYEPRIALTDGANGLSAYEVIAARVRDHLTYGGRVLVEIGPTQASAVSAIFRSVGLSEICVHTDIDGRDRVVSARA